MSRLGSGGQRKLYTCPAPVLSLGIDGFFKIINKAHKFPFDSTFEGKLTIVILKEVTTDFHIQQSSVL